MPHIHELIDFTVGVYIVHDSKVLLVHHKKFDKWLSVGGHIELHEDPEEALFREVKEETGLEIKLWVKSIQAITTLQIVSHLSRPDSWIST